ncbi:MAG: ABC transporter permease [Anaerolineae bacterium]|nr:ABC transporter permease [Anaerolineae bacterium]
MRWHIVWAIARKDIVDGVKNLYVLFSLLLPIGMSLLFRLVFHTDMTGSLTVAVYDPGSSRLVAGLHNSPQVQLIRAASAKEVEEKVKDRAIGGIVIPEDFDAAVAAGERPILTVYLNARRGSGELLAFQRLVEQQVWALVHAELPARIAWTDVSASPGLRSQGAFNFGLYTLILMMMLALSMTGTFVVPLLLVEEKEKHTLQALLLSPARPSEVTAGKALTGLVYTLLIVGVLVGLNRGWVGDWPVTILTLLLGSLLMIAVGLLVGGLFHTTMQVNTWSTLIMLVLVAPSWFTVVNLPVPLKMASALIPTYYLVEALQLALAGEASLARVGPHLAVLTASTLIAFAVVAWALRRGER